MFWRALFLVPGRLPSLRYPGHIPNARDEILSAVLVCHNMHAGQRFRLRSSAVPIFWMSLPMHLCMTEWGAMEHIVKATEQWQWGSST